jgi:hypothetical protein
MTTTEVINLLAATSESIARLSERVKRMEDREARIESLIREIKASEPTRRKFRPMDTRKVHG